jgi:hypothetical protein
MSDIEDRIGAAFEKMRARQMTVRAVYLSPADYKAYAKSRSAAWGSEVVPLSVGDVQIISETLIPAMGLACPCQRG